MRPVPAVRCAWALIVLAMVGGCDREADERRRLQIDLQKRQLKQLEAALKAYHERESQAAPVGPASAGDAAPAPGGSSDSAKPAESAGGVPAEASAE